MAQDKAFDKDILIYQFKKILRDLEDTEDLMDMLEEKPYLCGNATVLNYPQALKINVRIDLYSIAVD
jgi:hypothetical protein